MTASRAFHGVIPAMAIPFRDDYKIDEEGLARFARWLAGRRGVTAVMTPAQAPAKFSLTPREREIASLVSEGLSNKEIALAMQVGEETIKWHVKNLFAKLNAGTRKQVVQRAGLLGLLEAGA